MKDFIPENFRTPRKSRFKFVFRMFSETMLFDYEFINSKYKDVFNERLGYTRLYKEKYKLKILRK